MEINGGEVIEVAKALSKPLTPAALSKPLTPTSSSSPAAGRPNPDLAEADSQLAEQENGPDGMADIANDDQDPGGEVKDDENQVFFTEFFDVPLPWAYRSAQGVTQIDIDIDIDIDRDIDSLFLKIRTRHCHVNCSIKRFHIRCKHS